MKNAVVKELENFAPKEYYETVMDFYGVDIDKYPWMLREYDPSIGARVMFAVFNFYIPTADKQPVSAMVVIYKSLQSKSSFKRFIYLNNMYPACQVPPPLSYRSQEEK